MRAGLVVRPFRTPAAWRKWLAANHAKSPGIWIEFARKDSGIASIDHAQALDVALAHGWIDGQAAGVDEVRWLQRFTPRTPRSKWSKINCAKAESLIVSGEMHPAGLAQVEAARADGRWAAAYHSPRSITVPDDLRQRLDASPRAAASFAGLDSRNRYAILYRLQDAKKPETRARRLERFVTMLERGETLH